MNINYGKVMVKQVIVIALFGVATSALAGPDGCLIRTPVESSNLQAEQKTTLYSRLGGYDAISAVVEDLLPRLMADPQLGRFWANRGADGIEREKQLVINFIVNQAGGPLHYSGRDMVTTHKGMKISNSDWKIFMAHLNATLEKFKVPGPEKIDVVNFMESLKGTMVET